MVVQLHNPTQYRKGIVARCFPIVSVRFEPIDLERYECIIHSIVDFAGTTVELRGSVAVETLEAVPLSFCGDPHVFSKFMIMHANNLPAAYEGVGAAATMARV